MREEKGCAELIRGQEGPMVMMRPQGYAISTGLDTGAEHAG